MTEYLFLIADKARKTKKKNTWRIRNKESYGGAPGTSQLYRMSAAAADKSAACTRARATNLIHQSLGIVSLHTFFPTFPIFSFFSANGNVFPFSFSSIDHLISSFFALSLLRHLSCHPALLPLESNCHHPMTAMSQFTQQHGPSKWHVVAHTKKVKKKS